MSDKDLHRHPHHVRGDQTWWWYDDEKGIDVVVESAQGTSRVVTIPWRSLRAALTRKDKR